MKLYNIRSYVENSRFWSDPYINLTNSYGIMFFVSLGIIGLGIVNAFQRLKLLGIFPLLIHFVYSLSIVVARIAGWRFILPVDWILLVYFCIGSIQLIEIAASVVWDWKPNLEDVKIVPLIESGGSAFFRRKTYITLIGFLIIGLSLPVIELAMPVRYPPLTKIGLVQTYIPNCMQLDLGECIESSTVINFLETQKGATVMYGRALYPSYYEKGKYWGDNNPFLVQARKYDRLQFTYIGSENALVYFQLDSPPHYFPNASDVFIVGCREAAGIRALAIKVNDQTSFLTNSAWQGLTCPAQ
jgi:hypothetical protein